MSADASIRKAELAPYSLRAWKTCFSCLYFQFADITPISELIIVRLACPKTCFITLLDLVIPLSLYSASIFLNTAGRHYKLHTLLPDIFSAHIVLNTWLQHNEAQKLNYLSEAQNNICTTLTFYIFLASPRMNKYSSACCMLSQK